jgi:hypothetical protein
VDWRAAERIHKKMKYGDQIGSMKDFRWVILKVDVSTSGLLISPNQSDEWTKSKTENFYVF